MRLIRFGSADQETPGVLLDDGTRLDVSSFVRDYDEYLVPGDVVELGIDHLGTQPQRVIKPTGRH